jgi:hypothetical protein
MGGGGAHPSVSCASRAARRAAGEGGSGVCASEWRSRGGAAEAAHEAAKASGARRVAGAGSKPLFVWADAGVLNQK